MQGGNCMLFPQHFFCNMAEAAFALYLSIIQKVLGLWLRECSVAG
jgi:hypothetical protein